MIPRDSTELQKIRNFWEKGDVVVAEFFGNYGVMVILKCGETDSYSVNRLK